MDLTEASALFTALTGLPAVILREEEDLARLCQRARFHKTQTALSFEAMKDSLSSMGDLDTLFCSDHLQVRLLAGKVQGQTLAAGPFCCETLSTMDARALLKRAGLPLSCDRDLLAFRSSFPVLTEKEALRLFRNLLAFVSGASLLPETLIQEGSAPLDPETEQLLERPFAEIVEERYAREKQLMQSIREGNASRAITCWRDLHRKVEFMREKVGHTPDGYRHSATITRTVIRLAAMEAGVPPVVLDEITGEISRRNREARSVDEILLSTELLIRRICGEVQKCREESPLAGKVRHTIYAHYQEDLTSASLGEYLGMSPSRLIERFRKETGQTPGALLRRVRMEHAAQALEDTQQSIQEIAASVGIPDAGYFARIFRSEYGMTPREYRQGKREE